MVFKFAYFVELTRGYQPAKFRCCRSSGSSFTEELQKYNDDVISYFLDSKFPYFVKLIIGYQPANFQIRQLSESIFPEVCIRHPKSHYDVTSQYLVFRIVRFVEFNQSYQTAKFQWPRLSGSNFTRGGGKHPLRLVLDWRKQGKCQWECFSYLRDYFNLKYRPIHREKSALLDLKNF